MRGLYKKTAKAVNKILLELWRDGLIFIIPTEEAMKIEGIHFHQPIGQENLVKRVAEIYSTAVMIRQEAR